MVLKKMNNRKEVFLLIFLVFLLIAINYNFLDGKLKEFMKDSEIANVQRIIDGDTIVVNNGTHVRLLGINTPEKNELYHDEAMNFLSSLISNKTIRLEFGPEKTDLYGRTLAYVILDSENINVEQVRNGFANYYIYNNDEYTQQLRNAWSECIAKNINLCKKSQDICGNCIELKNFDVKNQNATFYNRCDFDCDLTGWDIKDEGRKHFAFENFVLGKNKYVSVIVGNKTNTESSLYWKDYSYVWTSSGDSLFLRDKMGGLVLWSSY